MNVELINRAAPLTVDKCTITAPLENTVEPFLNSLSAFCPFEDFKKMLFEPEHYGKQPPQIFELAVSWLFSLAGFQTIHLGAQIKTSKGKKSFDSLVAKESGMPIGSADILAYEENERLLLIDCDIGGIDENKLGKLRDACKHLADANKLGKFSFVPVVCTPKECELRSENSVVIVDRLALEGIFEEIAKGNREAAKDKIFRIYGLI